MALTFVSFQKLLKNLTVLSSLGLTCMVALDSYVLYIFSLLFGQIPILFIYYILHSLFCSLKPIWNETVSKLKKVNKIKPSSDIGLLGKKLTKISPSKISFFIAGKNVHTEILSTEIHVNQMPYIIDDLGFKF